MSEYEGYDQLEYRATGKCSNPFAKLPNRPEKTSNPSETAKLDKNREVTSESKNKARIEQEQKDNEIPASCDWEAAQRLIGKIEPEPEDFKFNPFVEYDFGTGTYISTEFNCLAFLESFN